MFILPILFIILTISLILYLYVRSKERPKFFPPGPPRLPLWGSYWFMLKEHYYHAHLAFEVLAKRYKTDILGLYLGDAPTIVPMSYELCKEVLTRDEFAGRNDTIITRLRGLGGPRGIFFLDGPYWKDQRRFSLRHLRDFGFGRRSEQVESFLMDEIKFVIDILTNEPKPENADINPRKGVGLMPDLIYGCVLNSILMLLSSTTFDHYQLREVARAGLRFQRSGDPTGAAISITPWLRFIAPDYFGYTAAKENNEYMLNFVQKIIEEHRRTFSDDHHRDFVDVFLSEQIKTQNEEYNAGFTDKQLLLTVLDYMFPAPIAIGHTTNFYFASLINNPQVQEKIQQEIDSVIGSARLPTVDDRASMPYTEASIRESVRFLPLNPLGIPRRCMEDTILRGHFIPKDTIVLPCVWTAHKDEKIFGSNTDQYIPERFLDEHGNLKKKDYTIGFGGGKRLCAGETFARNAIFLLTTTLLQNYTLNSANGKFVDLSHRNIVPGGNLSINNNYILIDSR